MDIMILMDNLIGAQIYTLSLIQGSSWLNVSFMETLHFRIYRQLLTTVAHIYIFVLYVFKFINDTKTSQ